MWLVCEWCGKEIYLKDICDNCGACYEEGLLVSPGNARQFEQELEVSISQLKHQAIIDRARTDLRILQLALSTPEAQEDSELTEEIYVRQELQFAVLRKSNAKLADFPKQ